MKSSNLPFFVLLLLLRAVSNASSMVPEYDLHLKLFPEKNEMQVNGTVRFQLMKTDLYEIRFQLSLL